MRWGSFTNRKPTRKLLPQRWRLRMVGKLLGPLPERGSFEGKLHRFPADELRKSSPEIFHQNTPGHSIDGEVMNDEQKAAGSARAKVEQNHPDDWTRGDIERALRLCGCFF